MMRLPLLLIGLLGVFASQAFAFGNHALTAYLALEKMPEVANAAPVKVEPLEVFLKTQEKEIEKLMAEQEAWAVANIKAYAPRPAALNFKADPARSDEARRIAFLKALRVALNSKFALFIEPFPRTPNDQLPELDVLAVSVFPDKFKFNRYVAVKVGDTVSALEVVSTASEEPDYGLDINCWDDSPGEWGKTYGFGTLPFGNPALPYSTQAPFHMGFLHESSILYKAAPFVQRTFPQLRVHQYSTLASMAFRTGHPYWGWRFAGLALHYIQDLSQPYHSRLSPGNATWKLLGINILAMVGFPKMKEDMIVLLSNRHLVIDKYQAQLVREATRHQKDIAAVKELGRMDRDSSYPAWSEHYVRDVITGEAYGFADRITGNLIANLPPSYVSDPTYDFGVHGDAVSLVDVLSKQDAKKREQLDAAIGEIVSHFGSHSRNAIRGMLKAAK
jgi:hypothetical protein